MPRGTPKARKTKGPSPRRRPQTIRNLRIEPSDARHSAPARTILLPSDCTLARASELHASLSRVLTQHATLILDATDTRRIDAAGLQLLAAFIRDRRNNARAVSWKAMPAVIETAARRLGMQALLDPPSPGASRS